MSEIDKVFDVKAWIKPLIETPSGHSNPHNFLFRLGETGKAEMFYRNWSSDEWTPKTPEPGLQLLKVRIVTMQYIPHDILFIHSEFQSLPSGMPELLQPNYSKLDLPKLQADVASKYVKAGVPQEKLQFWEEIGEHLKCIEAKASSPPQWPLYKLKVLKSTCVLSGSSSENVPRMIITACDKDMAPIPEVRFFFFVIRVQSTIAVVIVISPLFRLLWERRRLFPRVGQISGNILHQVPVQTLRM